MGPIKVAVTKGPRALNNKGVINVKGGSEKRSLKSITKGKKGVDPPKPRKKGKHSANVRGLVLNKAYGQHLLRNPGITKKIVTACATLPSDIVLEIGPGTGNLTIPLLQAALRVVAVDIDERMISELRKRSAQSGLDNLYAHRGDALKFEFPNFHVCTGNMPYQISSPFIFKLVQHLKSNNSSNFKRAVLMFQKEYSLRLMAQAGDKNYCRLSVNTQLFFKIKKVCDVDRRSFNPPPKVDSMVVRLEPLRNQIVVDYAQWDGMLRMLFHRKNRTMRAALVGGCFLESLGKIYNQYADAAGRPTITDKETFKELLESCLDKVNLRQARSRTVTHIQFLQLLTTFAENHVYFVDRTTANLGHLDKIFDEEEELEN